MRRVIAVLVASVVVALLITRPHVERYYALVHCSSTEKCWTEKGWPFRESPLDELPDFHSCNQESIDLTGDHPRMGDAMICVERYRLEWGYRD
jgi:hypothetical protein